MENVKQKIADLKIIAWACGVGTFILGLCALLAGIGLLVPNHDLYSGSIKFLSILIGILLMMAGLGYVAYVFATKRDLWNLSAVVGAIVFTFGLVSLFGTAGELVLIVFGIIPYLMIVLGVLVLFDAIYDLFMATSKKEEVKKLCIFEMILGAVAILFGVLFLTVDALEQASLLIVGIILILAAAAIILNIFLHFMDKVDEFTNSLNEGVSNKKKTEENNDDISLEETTDNTPAEEVAYAEAPQAEAPQAEEASKTFDDDNSVIKATVDVEQKSAE